MSDKRLRRKLKTFILSSKYWWLLASVFLFSRIATIFFPFDSDHWIFYYVGKDWFDGGTLYLSVWDHKAPLIFAINGFMSMILGDSIILHRILFLVLSIITIWVFYATTKRLLAYVGIRNIESSARIATVVYAFWSNLSQFTNSGNTTENFGVLFLLLAFYCYLKFKENNLWKWLLYSGVSISLLVFLKINFSILVLPLALDFLKNEFKNIKRFLILGFIWLAPTIAQLFYWYSYFENRNLLKEAIIASISFNGKYLRAGWAGNLSGQFIFILVLLIALLFFSGFIYYALKSNKAELRSAMIITIAGSSVFFGIILGTFYNHYYLIILPYFSFLTAVYWRNVIKVKLLVLICAIGLVGSYGVSLKQLYNSFFGSAHQEAIVMTETANYIKQHTSKNDKIIYHGYGATFYHLSGRDSGSRFISASHPLIDEREKFGYDLTGLHIKDMEKTKPKYVIDKLSTKDLYNQNIRLKEYFDQHYSLEVSLTGYDILRRVN